MQDLQQQSLRQNQALLATVTLSFLMLLGSAGLTVHISREGVAADQLVVHTFEVQRTLNVTMITMGGVESGLRGYLLTGNEGFLNPYRQGRESLSTHLDHLHALVADNPSQVANLERIR